MESKVTGRVQLAISNLEAEHVVEAGVVLAEFSKTLVGASSRCTMHYFEFDFPDQGNGAHLQVRFQPSDCGGSKVGFRSDLRAVLTGTGRCRCVVATRTTGCSSTLTSRTSSKNRLESDSRELKRA